MWLSSLMFVVTVVCILVSTDLVEDRFQMRRRYLLVGSALAAWSLVDALLKGPISHSIPHIFSSIGLSAVLIFSGIRFWRIGHQREM